MQRRLLYFTLAVLFISGAYWALKSGPLMMKIHGAAAMVALVLIGALLPAHVPTGWAERRSRKSGIAMLVGFALLTVTGYFLYYMGDETARAISSDFHLALGLVLPIVLGVHLAANKPRQPAAPVAASQHPHDPKELAEWRPPSVT